MPTPVTDPAPAQLLKASDAVVVAAVEDVDAAPQAWSGMLTIRQDVTYEVETVLKGSIDVGTHLTLGHLLVHGSRTAAAEPGLRKDWFAKGQRLVLFLRATDGGFVPLDENRGAAPAEAALLEALRDGS